MSGLWAHYWTGQFNFVTNFHFLCSAELSRTHTLFVLGYTGQFFLAHPPLPPHTRLLHFLQTLFLFCELEAGIIGMIRRGGVGKIRRGCVGAGRIRRGRSVGGRVTETWVAGTTEYIRRSDRIATVENC